MTEIGDYLTVIYQLEPPAETGCVNFFSSSRPADHNIDHFECDISYRGREPAFDLEMATAKNLGREISSLPALIPDTSVPLTGTFVTLEAISQHHIDSLWRNLDLQRKGASLLDFLPWTVPNSPEELWTLLENFRVNRGFIVYAILADPRHVNPSLEDSSQWIHSETLGIIAYLEVRPAHRELEIGAVLYNCILQRSAAATEVMFLMLRNVCEASPKYRRISWKCNSLNEASRRAAERIGFKYEGTFRNLMIVKGRSRDSDWLSIIEEEWPVVKAALEQWLMKENFDQFGRQIKPVDEIRAGLNGL